MNPLQQVIKQRQEDFAEKFLNIHQGCDDGWYACPKSEDYFGSYENMPIENRPCYCHVENTKPKIISHNQKTVEAILEAVKEQIIQDNEWAAGSLSDDEKWAIHYKGYQEAIRNVTSLLSSTLQDIKKQNNE